MTDKEIHSHSKDDLYYIPQGQVWMSKHTMAAQIAMLKTQKHFRSDHSPSVKKYIQTSPFACSHFTDYSQ